MTVEPLSLPSDAAGWTAFATEPPRDLWRVFEAYRAWPAGERRLPEGTAA